MKEEALKRGVCQRCCSYYKPPKDKTLACMGFLVIKKLIKDGHKTHFRELNKAIKDSTSKVLINKLCKPCPFYETDCDFAEQKEKALPCGGFILLGQMIEEKIIKIEKITEAVNECL